MAGYTLSPIGQNIDRRGGVDGETDDAALVREIVKRAPGLAREDLESCFIAIMMEYGEDALFAIRKGYVKFEERPGGERTIEHKEGTDDE